MVEIADPRLSSVFFRNLNLMIWRWFELNHLVSVPSMMDELATIHHLKESGTQIGFFSSIKNTTRHNSCCVSLVIVKQACCIF